MQLFFFISGYFYKDEYSSNLKNLISKRLSSLYIPFLKYSLLFLLLHNVFYSLGIYNDAIGGFYSVSDFINSFIKIMTFDLTEPLLAAFWFFTSLFAVSILFGLISFVSSKFPQKDSELIRMVLIGICFFIGNITSQKYGIAFPRMLNTSLVALSVYYLGYLYRRNEQIIKMNIYFFSMSVLLLFLDSFYGIINMSANSYLSPSFFFVNSVVGIYANVYLAKHIAERVNSKLFYYIGQNTVIIMALHLLSFKVISFIQLKIYGYPVELLAKIPVIDQNNGWWIAYTLSGIFIPLAIRYMLDKTQLHLIIPRKASF